MDRQKIVNRYIEKYNRYVYRKVDKRLIDRKGKKKASKKERN